jgi:hypothetical protein
VSRDEAELRRGVEGLARRLLAIESDWRLGSRERVRQGLVVRAALRRTLSRLPKPEEHADHGQEQPQEPAVRRRHQEEARGRA